MIYAEAKVIADQLVERFTPQCERVVIAGSLRRHKSEVHDIDLVILPKTQTKKDCFDNPIGVESLFRPEEMGLGHFEKNGARQKQILLPSGIYVELWICLPPAQWGWQLVLRTGPADYTKWLVLPKRFGGALPAHLTVHDGALWNHNTLIPTPEEHDFYQAMGLSWVAPELRCPPQRQPVIGLSRGLP